MILFLIIACLLAEAAFACPGYVESNKLFDSRANLRLFRYHASGLWQGLPLQGIPLDDEGLPHRKAKTLRLVIPEDQKGVAYRGGPLPCQGSKGYELRQKNHYLYLVSCKENASLHWPAPITQKKNVLTSKEFYYRHHPEHVLLFEEIALFDGKKKSLPSRICGCSLA